MQFLNVSGNNLGASGFDYIIEGLKFNQDMLSLNASTNEIPW